MIISIEFNSLDKANGKSLLFMSYNSKEYLFQRYSP